jgi:hypothetical protein
MQSLPKPIKRRWLRFSLRTMFVLVTVASIVLGWMGWNLQIVRQRQSARKWLEDKGGQFWEIQLSFTGHPFARDPDIAHAPARLRTMLGDRPAMTIELPSTLTETERLRIWNLFPEAGIIQWDSAHPGNGR